MQQLSKIALYVGPGVSRQYLPDLHRFFSRIGSVQEFASLDGLNGIDFFVMPGGADLPYCEHLNGAPNQLLIDYVQKGGVYIGLCAGAYYAAKAIEFAKGDPSEIAGRRELGFFPGLVRGPTFGPYIPGELGRVISLRIQEKEYASHYHGGGYFVDAADKSDVSILARFADNQEAAIVRCQVGKGFALLSSVHVEKNIDSGLTSRILLELQRK